MKIIKKEILAQDRDTKITRFDIQAPLIASKAKPGQFVVLMVTEQGERIPLTVVEINKEDNIVTLIVQEIGFTTKLLDTLETGDSLYALVGPLGHATEIKKYGKVILVAGGVGIAEIYPVAKALKKAGNDITTILGTRTKDLLFLEKKLNKVSNSFYIVTDDGSYGKKGFTTDVLKGLLEKNIFDIAYAVGPIPMMEKVSKITKGENLKTIVSLNALMVDATGMCGGCRVSIGGDIKFTCVDGPEFDAHLVNWDELKNRTKIYESKERYICKLNEK